jgi:hypothetical protein
MANKYTYDNWWNGDVTLVYATRVFDKGDEPRLADWIDFSESDVEKIKEKQLGLYTDKVNTLLKAHSEQFLKRYNASEMKSELFNDEYQECNNIMFGVIPNIKVVHLKHWDIGLDNQYITDIQQYIQRTIKKGIDDGLGFIHSPNSKYEDRTKPDSRIYARFIWQYLKWLESLVEKESKSEIPTNPIDESKHISEPKNKYPSIFKNGYAYQMFLELKAQTAINKDTELANYAFIYHQMKRVGFILPDVKHKTFMKFLNDEYGKDITAIKFNFMNPASKMAIFSNLLEKFRPLIDSMP